MIFLITGAAGFLGTALANALAREGHQVRGLDDLSAGNPDGLSPAVHFVRGDVNDRPRLWSLLQGVDVVYHLAARVSVQESILYPREYNAVNVGGTVSLMEAMRDVGIRRVVLASSGAVYGEQQVQPLHEEMRPRPRSPYAVSKLAAEHYICTIGDLWGIESAILRIFNAYGPRQNLPPTHPPVVPHFLRQTLKGGSLVVHGDGRQTRDYVYVDDVVRALVAAATAPNLNGQVINVGSGRETSVRDLAAAVAQATGLTPDVIYSPRASAGVARMRADLTRARALLGYAPRVDLVDGLRLTLKRDPRFSR